MSCEWKEIYDEFKELYPELWKKGTSYIPYEYMVIEIRIPSVGKYLYDYRDGELTCLEHWTDKKEVVSHKKQQREDMYSEFCGRIEEYLYFNKMSHQQLSDKVGISRQSLSKYLNGSMIPKINTMKQIYEAINIEL